MDHVIEVLKMLSGSGWGGAGMALTLWPLLALLGMKVLQAQWMIPILGRGLKAAQATGVGIGSMPKAGVLRFLFQPMVYAGVYLIALAMATMDGILSKSDASDRALINWLVDKLEGLGANDSLLYLQHKNLEPGQAAAVKTMQMAMANGVNTLDAAQAAVIVADIASQK